jgi:hypothetical protein
MLCAIILLVGCSIENQADPTKDLTPTPDYAPSSEAVIPIIIVTNTPVKAYSTAQGALLLPTVTITSQEPTWTPRPTLNPDEAIRLVQDLLVDNCGCRLLCYWGVVPGETTWQEAKSFLEAFAHIEEVTSRTRKTMYS